MHCFTFSSAYQLLFNPFFRVEAEHGIKKIKKIKHSTTVVTGVERIDGRYAKIYTYDMHVPLC